MSDPRHALGRRAEAAVAAWLRAQGWTILATRWRCPQGELDLVCRDLTGELVAVEVKLRRAGRAGTALEALTARQLHRLRAALAAYVRTAEGPHHGVRIDLVELRPAEGRGTWLLRRHPVADAW